MLPALLLVCAVGLTACVPLESTSKCGYESCTPVEAGMLNVHIVPHTHDDVGWLETVDQYYYGSKNSNRREGRKECVQCIIDSVVEELWIDPKRRFIYVETAFFWKWWMCRGDEVRHKVHTLVRQGRLQFVGGAWSMNDEAATHYQSVVDQFTWGLSKLNETFGECGRPRVGWQIDPFGHSREFASLLAAMGYDGLFLGRIDYQDKMTRLHGKQMEMLWRGDDDLGRPSDIFTGVLYNTYSPPAGFCFDVLCIDEPIYDDPKSPIYNVEKRVNLFLAESKNISKAYSSNHILITMGQDFSYQDAAMWYINLDKLIKYTNLKAAKDNLNIKLFYSTPDCYLKAIHDANPTLPTKQDDFFPYASDPTAFWTGYFTSRPTTKYFEREGNNYLQMVKQLQVLAYLPDQNRFLIDELKSAMGVMQHHDAITGTEKQHVTHDYVRLLNSAVEDAATIARQAFNKAMQGDAGKPPLFSYERCALNESRCDASENSNQFVVTVYNNLAWNVNESVRVPVVEGNYAVYAPNGQQIVSQLVEIPAAVLRIPNRQSKASHEIVFIAYLKPLSFKSYYVKKSGKVKREDKLYEEIGQKPKDNRKNDYYTKVNDYWKKVREQTSIDIKNIEEVYKTTRFNKHTDDLKVVVTDKIPDEPIYEPGGNNYKDNAAKDSDLEMLKGGREDTTIDINQYEKLIQEAKKFVDEQHMSTKPKASFDRNQFKNLNAEEMRMSSDDPMAVERYTDDVFLENENIKLRINNTTGQSFVLLPDGTEVKFDVNFFYYPGCFGDNVNYAYRSSGAYIFRPNATNPLELGFNYTQGPSGPLVKELIITFSDNVAAFVRIYDGMDFIENEWIVGPIDVKDNIGKEYVVRYSSDVVNNGEFYTDSNGRQMLKRKLNQRPQYNLTLREPIAGNYYPVTNKIYIHDDKVRVAVLTDRSEGGSSLLEGQVELMLHRRLLHDDAFGVGEALNETAEGKGIVVRGRHRIYISKSDDKDFYVKEKKQGFQFHMQPLVFISDAKDVSFDKWMNLTKAHSFANALPDGIHLLTLEPWYGTTLLLRLENYLELSDGADSTIEVDLETVFKSLTVKSIKETTLAANQWLHGTVKWGWDKGNEFTKSFNEEYGNFNPVEKAKDMDEVADDGLKVKIKSKQIRTFVVDYELGTLQWRSWKGVAVAARSVCHPMMENDTRPLVKKSLQSILFSIFFSFVIAFF